jgi:hypothetical protein
MAGITGLILSEKYEDFFHRKNVNHWAMYTFSSDSHLELDQGGGTGWEEMTKCLPQDEVRYVIANFSYISPVDYIQRTKRIFLMWAPESAPIREKLKVTMYSLEAQKMLSTCGFHVTMQAHELCDVDKQQVLERIRQHSTVF